MTAIGGSLPAVSLPPTTVAPVSSDNDGERTFADELLSLLAAAAPQQTLVDPNPSDNVREETVASSARVFNQGGFFGLPIPGDVDAKLACVATTRTTTNALGSANADFAVRTIDAVAGGVIPRSPTTAPTADDLVAPAQGDPPTVVSRSAPVAAVAQPVPPALHREVASRDLNKAALTPARQYSKAANLPNRRPAAVTATWNDASVAAVISDPPQRIADRLRLRDKVLGLIARLGFQPAANRSRPLRDER